MADVRAAVGAWDALRQGACLGGGGSGAQLVPSGARGLLRRRRGARPSGCLIGILVRA